MRTTSITGWRAVSCRSSNAHSVPKFRGCCQTKISVHTWPPLVGEMERRGEFSNCCAWKPNLHKERENIGDLVIAEKIPYFHLKHGCICGMLLTNSETCFDRCVEADRGI